jgi:hypothetical protein
MRFLLALASSPAQDNGRDRQGARRAQQGLTALDRFAVDRALRTSSSSTTRRSRSPHRPVPRRRAPDRRPREGAPAILKEMEKVEVNRDKDGKIVKGDLNKWTFLKRDHDVVWAKIEILNGAVPRIASAIGPA